MTLIQGHDGTIPSAFYAGEVDKVYIGYVSAELPSGLMVADTYAR
jgi:hypothetical protein